MLSSWLRTFYGVFTSGTFYLGLGLGAFSSWSDNMVCRVFMVVGKKYDMICLLNVHDQCIWMHCKYTTHHDNDKSVWLWISGYDMLLIWIGFKSSKRNVMRYTCYVSSATFYCHLKLPWWNSHYIMAYLYVASASGKSRNFCCIANKSSRKNESKCVYECV